MNTKFDQKPLKTGPQLKRRAYTTPVLRIYGAVARYTQGSNGDVGDAGSQNMQMSDPALKTNIVNVGTHPLGFGLYLFDYKTEFQATAGFGRQFGVMADEVDTVIPEAVVLHADGYRRVNYAMLGIDFSVRSVQ